MEAGKLFHAKRRKYGGAGKQKAHRINVRRASVARLGAADIIYFATNQAAAVARASATARLCFSG